MSYGEFLDHNVTRWENVSFFDNYYQELGNTTGITVTPNGRPIAGADINLALSGDPKQGQLAQAGFTADDFGITGVAPYFLGISGPHSRVWRWYAGTTDLELDFFESTEPNEQIVRTSLDLTQGGYLGGDTWYRARGFAFDDPQAPWEGIGTGWFLSPQGGGATTSAWTVPERVQVTFDNTEVPGASQGAVPTIFNGDFEQGMLHRTARFPYYVGHDMLATPGWSYHGGDFASNVGTIVQGLNGNHAIELRPDASFMVHNRVYVPATVTSVNFDISTPVFHVGQFGQLSVTAKTGENNSPISIGTVALDRVTNGFERKTLTIPTSLRGQVVTLRCELLGANADPVLLDNIAFGPTGQPLQAAQPGESSTPGVENNSNLSGLLESAQQYWAGLINVPVGATGGVGIFGVAAETDVDQGQGATGTNAQANGGAGFGQSGFDHQHFSGNSDFIHEMAFNTEQIATFGSPFTNQIGVNSDPALTSDGHPVQAQSNSRLVIGQHESVLEVTGEQTLESKIGDNGACVDHCAIGVANVDVGLESAAPGGYGAGTDLQVLDLEKVPLLLLQSGTDLFQVPGLEGPHVFPVFAAGLSQHENQQNPSILQHSLSFDSLTVLPDREVVNHSLALSAEQLDLLSRATITIANLADGYLALTLGTTITLDTDAAGYGWFIDPTPFTNEEFVNGSSSVNGHSSIDPDVSALSPHLSVLKPQS